MMEVGKEVKVHRYTHTHTHTQTETYLVIKHKALVGVLDELVDGEGGVVGLHHRVGHLCVCVCE